MATKTTRDLSPSPRSQRWRKRLNHSQPSGTSPVETGVETEERSYRAYIQRIRESKPYWPLLRIYGFSRTHGSPPLQHVSPISILEVASDESLRYFNYKTYEDLREHLRIPYICDENGLTNTSSRGRRIVLMTGLISTVLEVLGDVYCMDFGFFADHLLPDEHMSYTAKTTRGNHCHVLEGVDPPSRRFQFEYRELSRFRESSQSLRSVRRVFRKPNIQSGWDAIFQRRFSVFSHTPPGGGLTTGEGSLLVS